MLHTETVAPSTLELLNRLMSDQLFQDFRLASLEDIAAMKLNAITGNGTRIKDFIDIAYLSSIFSFNQMLDFYNLKYNSSTLMPMKAITYFDDINFKEPIKMINGNFSWKIISKRLELMQRHSSKRFPIL